MPSSCTLPCVTIDELKALIRDVPDFPKPGIVFKDITPLLANPRGMKATATHLVEAVRKYEVEELVGIESRGFIFGAAVAAMAEMPFHLIRKPGKLPFTTAGRDYELEYGSDRVEIHTDAITAGRRYALIDDLMATGGTAAAAAQLIEDQGGVVACCSFVIELGFLNGREKLGDRVIDSLITY